MEEAEPKPHRFSVAELEQLVDAGGFAADARVELLDGELIDVPPPNPPHAGTVALIQESLAAALGQRAHVRSQSPLLAGDYSQPEPDVAVVRRDPEGYRRRHPGPADTYAAIEISWSSLAVDRGAKLRVYARAGIPEYWIVDLRAETVDVYRDPHDLGYGVRTVVGRGAEVALAAFPDVRLRVDDIFG